MVDKRRTKRTGPTRKPQKPRPRLRTPAITPAPTEADVHPETAPSCAAEIESIYKHSGLGLCVLDREMRYVRINQRLAEMNGVPAADHIGKTVREVVPEVYKVARPIIRRAFGTGQPVLNAPLSTETLARPGVNRHWVVHCLPISSPDGQTLGVNFIVEEVTAYKLATDALRQSEADLAEAQRVAKIGNWTFDLATSKMRWSRELYRIFGVEERKDDVHYRFFLECVDTRDRPFVEKVSKEARITGKPIDIEFRIATPDGTMKTIREVGYARRDENGTVIGSFGTVQDITERKRVEEALKRAHAELEDRVKERTAELRQRSLQLAKLATELTLVEHCERRRITDYLHDNLQQVLVACRMKAEVLASTVPQRHRASLEILNDTLAEAIQASRTVSRRLAPPVPVYGHLPEAFQWLALEAGRLHNLAVAIDSPSDLPAVPEAESLLLFTAARELLLNVAKHAGVPEVHLRLAYTPDAITLTVGDSGRGTVRVGTASENQHGFGLFSIRERAESLGGRLTVDSKPGHGMRVTLTLPLAAAPAACKQSGNPAREAKAVTQEPDQKSHAVSGRIRVLFVDDHQIVRESLVLCPRNRLA